jgi:hypothetical protein
MKFRQLGVLAFLVALAVQARGVVIPDATGQDESDAKAIRATIKAYDEAILKGDREKAGTFYAASREQDKKLVSIWVETDIQIEALHQAIDKKFGEETWKRLAPLVGGILPDKYDKIKVTPNDDKPGEVNADLYPKASTDSDHRWFSQVPMQPGKGGWQFADTASLSVSELVQLRRWSRDATAEVADLAAAVSTGKFKDADALDDAVRKMVNETLDNNAPADDNPPGVNGPGN